MSDPAAGAAERVLHPVRGFGEVGKVGEALVIAVAREALKPIRELHREWEEYGFLPSEALQILDALAKLIYTTEELEQ